ncbi:4,4'-diaponeurosporenoate glycosyltransferase [Anaerobranca californiensis DSM 14826]|jgi:4,4'-diaponeurosporenoate glycosyltransferase|uniref:4,4'-diaponeurosporenoate glycosyltransferase n=1 Tax=Anaerobranca californiensis DSM 14826 TaxID=1120989 RepID=A0A1M6R2N5_9FIRM|nr:glycosyltransferase family 2 protein [Anaerobranca californiensis]SHK26660.1 4,4'-diaponeurosporenoate glycosyltransferase [Anaerobranca californiensis DSM 14826]
MFIFRLFMWLCGLWLLFKIPDFTFKNEGLSKEFQDVSIIIPARNEEKNLPKLLGSIREQKINVKEIIVVDDQSIDKTTENAKNYGAKIVKGKPLPSGWQGKSWALWQGVENSSGDILIFLDADTSIEQDGLVRIYTEFLKEKTPLSIQPYHKMEKLYENLSAIFNLILMMGTNVFTPLGKRLKPLAFFGPCQIMTKEDYFKVGGHTSAKGSILEDISLGKNFLNAGIPIRCFGGRGAISFRMYPGGIKEIIEGWSKNFASGAGQVGFINLLLITLWVSGMVGVTITTIRTFLVGEYLLEVYGLFLLYGLQLYWLLSKIGNFSPLIIISFPINLLFFIYVFIRSFIMTFIFKRVNWKGRKIKV